MILDEVAVIADLCGQRVEHGILIAGYSCIGGYSQLSQVFLKFRGDICNCLIHQIPPLVVDILPLIRHDIQCILRNITTKDRSVFIVQDCIDRRIILGGNKPFRKHFLKRRKACMVQDLFG